MLCCGRRVFMYSITDFSKFASELGFVFEFIQKSDDKKQLRDIIESKEAYHHIDVTTVDLINTYTAANIPTEETEGETIDMCKAIQEMMEDSRNERDSEINNLIQKLRKSGASDSQILCEIEKNINKNAPRSRKKRADQTASIQASFYLYLT